MLKNILAGILLPFFMLTSAFADIPSNAKEARMKLLKAQAILEWQHKTERITFHDESRYSDAIKNINLAITLIRQIENPRGANITDLAIQAEEQIAENVWTILDLEYLHDMIQFKNNEEERRFAGAMMKILDSLDLVKKIKEESSNFFCEVPEECSFD